MRKKQSNSFLDSGGLSSKNSKTSQGDGEPLTWQKIFYRLEHYCGLHREAIGNLSMPEISARLKEIDEQRLDDMRFQVKLHGGEVDDLPEGYEMPEYASREDEEEGILSEAQVEFLEKMFSM